MTRTSFRSKLHEVIFEADTNPGKLFDVILIAAIVLSVLVVMLDSVENVQKNFGTILYVIEWFFTILFSIEYVFRLYCVGRPLAYATGFYGIVDLLSILPTYVSLLMPGTQYFLVIRSLRLLRIFRVLKLVQYLGEARRLTVALKASQRKITVFLFVVVTIVIIFGSIMYVVESRESGFTSIPRSIYWAIVTLTTVGYGDISPKTGLGQALASLIMILGYGIIAVPTGIVTVEMSKIDRKNISTQACPKCAAEGHDSDAKFCKFCGAQL